VLEIPGEREVLGEAVDDLVPFIPPVAEPIEVGEGTPETLLLGEELLLCRALLAPVTELTGVRVPPTLVKVPKGGVADAQGQAVRVEDPVIVPPTALPEEPSVKVGVKVGKVGKEVEVGLELLLSLKLTVGVPLMEGVVEGRGSPVAVKDLREESDCKKEAEEDAVRLAVGVEDFETKGEGEVEEDPVTRAEELADNVIEGEELEDLVRRSLPLPRLVTVTRGVEEEVRLEEGVWLELAEFFPLPVTTVESEGMATDAVPAAPLAVPFKGGLLEGFKGLLDASLLLDTPPLPEGVRVTLSSAVNVDDMDKDGVEVPTTVTLLLKVGTVETFEDAERSPLVEVVGEWEGVREGCPVNVPPPPPPPIAAFGVPVPAPVPLATPTVKVGAPDLLPIPEGVF
jgi:hypothetical protein